MNTRIRMLSAALLLTACAGPRTRIEPGSIETLLDEQAAAWNRGDLPAFVSGYWRDAGLTFVGSSGLLRGFDEMVDRYNRRYPDAAHRGTLEFKLREVRPLGYGWALVIGEYALARPAVGDANGMFTLIVERGPSGLRIVHDHSSAIESNDP